MIDETNQPEWTSAPQPEAAAADNTASAAQPAGFCQDCGRPLTRETVRTVGTGVFCEPCLQARVAGAMPGANVPPPPPASAAPVAPVTAGEPSPVLAGLLALFPGAGAMYNGQFAKGIAILVIFSVLMWLSDNVVHALFGIMAAGWYIYQVFDAVFTARSRREGLPLPDPFGLNDIGDRLGYSRNWAVNPNRAPQPAQPWTGPAAGPQPPQTPWAATPAGQANWAGYVPPTAFVPSPYVTPAGEPATSAQPHVPAAASFSSTYTGQPGVPMPLVPAVPPRRFPSAAIWLIALGFIFLLSNVLPFQLNAHWVAPVVLAGAAAWSLYRRLGNSEQLRLTAQISGRSYTVSLIRMPIILLVIALMLTLQNLDIATIAQTFPVLLIAIGVLALVDRATGYAPPANGWPTSPIVPPAASSAEPPTSSATPRVVEEHQS